MSAPFDRAAVLRQLRSRALLMQIGEQAIAIIKDRTLRGIFLEGSSPGTSKYSTTPMPLPLGILSKTHQGLLWRRLQRNEEEYRIFTNRRSGIVWVALLGGYKRFRELAGREVDHVTLNWSGTMMRDLQVASVDEAEGKVKISFSSYRSAQLASYHHAGVGRSRKKRIFLGLSAQEQEMIAEDVMKRVDLRL